MTRAHASSTQPAPEDEPPPFVDLIRAIQDRHPKAHAALLNWARWSREVYDIFPSLEVWGGWSMGLSTEEWASEGAHGAEDTARRKRSEPLKEVRPDPLDEERSLERQAAELDEVINNANDLEFPTIWRRIIKAAYCYRRVPPAEHQYPQEAGISNPSAFLELYESCLAYLEGLTPEFNSLHSTGSPRTPVRNPPRP